MNELEKLLSATEKCLNLSELAEEVVNEVLDETDYTNDEKLKQLIIDELDKKGIKYYEQMLEELTEIYIRYNQNSKFAKDSFEHQMLVVLEDYRLEHIDEYSVPVNETPEYIANLEKEYSELQKNTEEMNSIIKKYKTISIVGTFTAVASLTTSIVLAVKLINKRRK